jgi:hypothetical protein
VIGGFGVMGSSAELGGPTIDFGVMANRFFVAAPADPLHPAVAPRVPFVVKTTAEAATASTPEIPAGVYMDEVFIRNASIAEAKIASVRADSVTTGVLRAVVSQTGAIYNGVPAYTMTQNATTKVWTAARNTSWKFTDAGNNGYYLGSLDGSPMFYVGTSANYMYWRGSTLKVKGEVHADLGSFGGTIIGNGHIRSTGKTTLNDPAGGFYLEKDGSFSFGSATKGLNWSQTNGTLDFSGTLNVKSAASGARLEITNDYIKVFEAGPLGTSVLRVQIGNLNL